MNRPRRCIHVRPPASPTALLLLLAAVLVGCGNEMSGTYEDAEGMARLEFEDDNKVYFTFMGTTVLSEYEVDGHRLIIRSNGTTQVLTRNGEAIEGFGPLELTLVRTESVP